MRTLVAKASLVIVMLCVSAFPRAAWAQASSSPVAPTLIPVSGQLLKPDGSPRSGEPATLLVSLYNTDEAGEPPRWLEEHRVTLDAAGGYAVQFGSSLPDGLPVDLFAAEGGARWLGVTAYVTGPGGESQEIPLPKVMLISVPYAAKAATAETLGGRAPSDFVLSSTFRDDLRTVLQEEGIKASLAEVSAEATTTNFMAKFADGAGGLTDSVIFDNGTNIGIGTTSPQHKVDVRGSGTATVEPVFGVYNPLTGTSALNNGASIKLGFSPTAYHSTIATIFESQNPDYLRPSLAFFTMGDSATVATERMRISSSGNIGIGTTTPAHRMDVRGTGASLVEPVFGVYNPLSGTTAFNGGAAIRLGWSPTYYHSTIAAVFEGQNPDYLRPSLAFFTMGDSATVSTERMRISSSGNVGIGTTTPTQKLEVAGNIQATGTISGGNVIAKYQDVAEWVDSDESLEPGTVVIIDIDEHNHVKASSKANDTRVAGAVSPQPGLILGEPGEGRVLVAQSGRVRIKADARNAAIKPGDLLVTSPLPGHAMKAKSPKPGTVLGKALEPLEKGTGEILVLLTLQ